MVAMFPRLVPDPPSPSADHICSRKQEPHVSTRRTQTGGHNEPHLTRPRPSIINEVKCDELLLRAHKERSPGFRNVR